MRILLIHPNRSIGPVMNWYGEAPLGILYLSAVLEKAGHLTDLIDLTPYLINRSSLRSFLRGKTIPTYARDLLERTKAFKPDLIGFSVVSTHYSLSVALSNLIKESFDVPIIFGGSHPTVDPEETISEKAIDMICIGEGEHALLELVTKIDEGKDISQVKNIWIKEGSNVLRNPIRPLIQDIDSLPYPNREILDKRYFKSGGTSFITGRGCPYQCSYCVNSHLQKLYRGLGKFIRYRSIQKVIDEINYTIERYKIRKVTFSDETFTTNKKRTIEFCNAYKKEIGLPFICQTRCDTVDRELVTTLKDAGCELVSMGIESGNDFLREHILNRKMPRDKIIKAFRLAREAGISTNAFNMIGVPFETERTIDDTININRVVTPDGINCSLFMPFKGTRLGELCEKKGWIKNPLEELPDYYYDTVLEPPSISRTELIAHRSLFDLYVHLQEKYHPLLNLFKFLWVHLPSEQLRSIYGRLINAGLRGPMLKLAKKEINP